MNNQKMWGITAHVRKRGAQGIFYDKTFITFGEGRNPHGLMNTGKIGNFTILLVLPPLKKGV